MTTQERRRGLLAIEPITKGLKLLASGTFVRSSTSPVNMTIPVSFSGTVKAVYVCVETPLDATNQAISVFMYYDTELDNFSIARDYPNGVYMLRRRNSSNAYAYMEAPLSVPIHFSSDQKKLVVDRPSTIYILQPNTYKWYIWGED